MGDGNRTNYELWTTMWRGEAPKKGDFIYQDGPRNDPHRVFRVLDVGRMDDGRGWSFSCERVKGFAPWAQADGATVFHWDWRIIGTASWGINTKAAVDA